MYFEFPTSHKYLGGYYGERKGQQFLIKFFGLKGNGLLVNDVMSKQFNKLFLKDFMAKGHNIISISLLYVR